MKINNYSPHPSKNCIENSFIFCISFEKKIIIALNLKINKKKKINHYKENNKIPLPDLWEIEISFQFLGLVFIINTKTK